MVSVSVIMPTYNAESTIVESICSVLNQDYKDFELIIVDDGSNDRTAEIIKQMQSDGGDKIRLISQANGGTASAQNAGFAAATGRFIALIDADDLWHEKKLGRQIEHLNQRPEVGVSYCYSRFIDAFGKLLDRFQKPKLKSITLKDLLCRHPPSNGSTVLFRREILDCLRLPSDGAQFVDTSMGKCHDIELWMRAGVKSPLLFEGIGEVLTYYRLRNTGNSSALSEKSNDFERMLHAISLYAPELIDEWGSLARAYHLRFLARKAISMSEPKTAIRYFWQALLADSAIVLEEPLRTLETGAAAFAQLLAPSLIKLR